MSSFYVITQKPPPSLRINFFRWLQAVYVDGAPVPYAQLTHDMNAKCMPGDPCAANNYYLKYNYWSAVNMYYNQWTVSFPDT